MLKVLCGRDYGAFKALPDSIEVFRGVHARDADQATEMVDSGFSWSLCQLVASKFAWRDWYVDNGSPFVAKGRAKKLDVIAYFPSSGEAEVFIKPCSVEWDWIEAASKSDSLNARWITSVPNEPDSNK